MKKDYIKRLEDALDEYNVSNKKEILKKYNKRYEFGLESGLSDEKIEEMLGDPIEVAKGLADVVDFEEKENNEFKAQIYVSSEDLEFVPSKDDGFHIELNELDQNDYKIEKDDNHLYFKRNKSNLFGTKITGSVSIEVPKNLKINDYDVTSSSADINIDELNAYDTRLRVVSGDIRAKAILSDYIRLESVSGDIEINNIKAKRVNIDTVSGDVKIASLIADELIISSISGDVEIESAYVGKITSNAVSGEIKVNGELVGFNVNNSIKNTFRKIKKAIKNEK